MNLGSRLVASLFVVVAILLASCASTIEVVDLAPVNTNADTDAVDPATEPAAVSEPAAAPEAPTPEQTAIPEAPAPEPTPEPTATPEPRSIAALEGERVPIECSDVGDLGPFVLVLPPWQVGEQRLYEVTKIEPDQFGRLQEVTTLVTLDVSAASDQEASFTWTNTAFDFASVGIRPGEQEELIAELGDLIALSFDYTFDSWNGILTVDDPEAVKADTVALLEAVADLAPRSERAEVEQAVAILESVPAETLADFASVDLLALHNFDGVEAAPGELIEVDDFVESPFGFLIPAALSQQLSTDLDDDECVVIESVTRPRPGEDFAELLREGFIAAFGQSAAGDLSNLTAEELAIMEEIVGSIETRAVGQWDASTGYFRSIELTQTAAAEGEAVTTTVRIVDVTPG